MPWVRFVAAFDFYPNAPARTCLIAHRPGLRLVSARCAAEAIAAGKAAAAARPPVKKREPDHGRG